ncbi:TPA: hypothetical protein RUW99_002408 [Aeromonas veronii]|nr:hypothetical protein [Aeromonas veronii]
MDKDNIIGFIKQHAEIDIFYECILGHDAWYFKRIDDHSAAKKYDDFKRFISKKLNIPFNNIAIVGSAKTKFSFSPTEKCLREFGDDSDLDLILVSKDMYRLIWNAYKELSATIKLKNYNNKCSNIFNGFISIKDNDDDYGHVDIKRWKQKIGEFKAELQFKFDVKHEINYRIYTDWESVQHYHLRGITKLKEIINETH